MVVVEEDLFNRLSIRGKDNAPSRSTGAEDPAARLPYTKASKFGVLLSSADAEQGGAGLGGGGGGRGGLFTTQVDH